MPNTDFTDNLEPVQAEYLLRSLEQTVVVGGIDLYMNANKITFIIFTNPSARAGYDTRSIFKWSLTGFNSEFSFSLTSCLTKTEEPSLPYYLFTHSWRENNWIHIFPKGISAM